MAADDDLLALFPLSTVVLYPGIDTPLHLFEPRYRRMAADVLDGDRRLGMVAVRPDHMHAMADDPPVFDVGCAGDIASAKRRPDGRYDIVLHGTHRFRIVEEAPRPPGRPYRVARVERLAEQRSEADVEPLAVLRVRVIEILGTAPGAAAPPAFEAIDDLALVGTLARALPLAPVERQELLEIDRLIDRFERLIELMSFLKAAQGAAGRPNSGTLH